MRSLVTALHDLLFPPTCFYCERHLEHSRLPLLCLQCQNDLRPTSAPCCSTCGIPFNSGCDHLCGFCLKKTPQYDFLRSAFAYEEPISLLLLKLKFSGATNVLPTIAHLVGRTGALTHYLEPDVIIPVPLHVSRLRERQFNQSLLLSRACFKKWRAKIKTNVLIRRYNTTPQSLLSGNERRQNLNGCFELTDNSSLFGKKILLVDDVLTTGSTVNECVKVLRCSQPESIEVFVIARSLANVF